MYNIYGMNADETVKPKKILFKQSFLDIRGGSLREVVAEGLLSMSK